MFDLGWSELLVIGIVALIVVGPKDLPRMLRTLGQYMAKAKSVAREFQSSLEEAARQADLDELRDVKKVLDREAGEARDAQYKLQRELSQSFMDEPDRKAETGAAEEQEAGKAPAKKGPAKSASAKKAPAKKAPAKSASAKSASAKSASAKKASATKASATKGPAKKAPANKAAANKAAGDGAAAPAPQTPAKPGPAADKPASRPAAPGDDAEPQASKAGGA